MVSSQAVLLLVPVRVVSRRPVHRRHLFFPILLTGFLTGALLLAMACTLMEFLFELNRNSIIVPFMFFSSTAIALLIWIGWTILFYQMSRRDKPETIILKQCRLLLKGSILELLIAVPTHIIVRSRDYCCAGMMTFLGIAVGVPVMLFSFGPSIYFLFVDRWHSLRPQPSISQKIKNNLRISLKYFLASALVLSLLIYWILWVISLKK
jgi:hypothetical protein